MKEKGKFHRMMLQRAGSVLACGATLLLLGSCLDSDKNLFDAEATKQIYDSGYPVSNIDPDMDWKTTQSVQLNVSVDEDELTKYRVRVYDSYPLVDESSAKLLAEGEATNGTPFVSRFDCPTSLSGVYVMRTDEHERNLVKYVAVEGGKVDAAFGAVTASSGASTRSGISTRSAFAATRSDEVTVPTYSPIKTEAEVEALLADATEFTAETSMEAGQVYYIPAGKSVTRKSNFGVNWVESTLIVQGTLIFDNPWGSVQAESETKVYVLNGGKINITDNTKFYLNCATLTNFKGGEVSGYNLGLNNNNSVVYNAGVFNVTIYEANGGTLYNAESGTMSITNAELSNWGITFLVNRGRATIDSSNYNSTFYNSSELYVTGNFQGVLYNTGQAEIERVASMGSSITNSCYIKFNGEFQGSLKIGDNTAAVIENNTTSQWGGTFTLGNNSMLLVKGNANFNGKNVAGPSSGHALVRVNNLTGAGNFYSTGNVYYEINSIDPDLQAAFDDWMAYVYQAFTNDNGTVSKWGESPFTLPAGDCTGEGTEPVSQGTVVEDTPITYTYVYEDNYPYLGDYDFNDIVLKVQTKYDREEETNKVKKVRISVNLAAVGATKKIGAALRLVNVNKADVESINFEGDTSMRSTLQNSLFETGTTEANDENIVIPLFGDAHAVYGYTTERPMLNTGFEELKETYTMDVVITLKNAASSVPLITTDNMDFFIGTSYGTRMRAEVHLYEFRGYGATARGDTYEENLDAAGNKTWALMVPGFRYPRENVIVTDAYPKFGAWAASHTSDLDWHEHPVEDNVDGFLF
jgi:LruC domain-containing protein